MTNFETCLIQVLQDEQGFVDHPADRGGPTNLGCTLKTLAAFTGKPCTVDDIRALTPETVAPIYRKFFWEPIKGDQLPPGLALPLFNQAVLRGPANAIRSLQVALRSIDAGIVPDGVIGPKTLAALNKANSRKIVFQFLRESHDAYLKIVQADPTQLAFIRGWSNRIFDLLAANFG